MAEKVSRSQRCRLPKAESRQAFFGGTANEHISAVQRYLASIGRVAFLTKQEQLEQGWMAQQGSRGARDALVRSALPFVATVAAEYRNRGLDFDELIAAGNLGLIKAAEHYDPERGAAFLSYAEHWIRNEMLGALHTEVYNVRRPYSHMKRVSAIREARHELYNRYAKEPEHEDVARLCGMSLATMLDVLLTAWREVSLESAVRPDGDAKLHKSIESRLELAPDASIIESQNIALMRKAFQKLIPQQQLVLVLRYGFDGNDPRTLQEVGEIMGLSRERIRQIAVDGVERLQRLMHRYFGRERRCDKPLQYSYTVRRRTRALQAVAANGGQVGSKG